MRHPEASPRTLRVASLNLLNSPARLDERYRLLQQELEALNPDVLCMQEIIEYERGNVVDALKEVGFTTSHFGGTITSDAVVGAESIFNGCAVFTKTEDVKFSEIGFANLTDELPIPAPHFGLIPTVAAEINLGDAGGVVHVLSSHFAWGDLNEAYRLRQAVEVDRYARRAKSENRDAVVILGGDLNAVPDASTIRFLRGLDSTSDHLSTHWVDAWDMWGTPDNEFTSSPATNSWSKATAAYSASVLNGITNLRPELVPARRIDFLLSQGWVYGRRGGPLSFGQWAEKAHGGLEISDHAGIYADYML